MFHISMEIENIYAIKMSTSKWIIYKNNKFYNIKRTTMLIISTK